MPSAIWEPSKSRPPLWGSHPAKVTHRGAQLLITGQEGGQCRMWWYLEPSVPFLRYSENQW